ncbi:hypothetical protein NSE01_00620 [Novosphingobium sediminis]|uniref:Heme NO-binding domain-containing protein n=1 Tax=Novosphingobium sediminis TaxID=707214 RepID=A0A512AEU7_9SPHN|nr:hypothetical protein NSE01_00620 [Novosphingobium sediminis]
MRETMKGVVFNLLEDAVAREHGLLAWDGLLEMAGLEGAYTSLGSYPDSEVIRLIDAASIVLGVSAGEVLRWFGRSAIPLLFERYEKFFTPHVSAQSFVASINDVIHPEVRKLYTGAACPHFHFHDLEDGRTGLAYKSPRRMCQLAHGFIEGAADHYGNRVAIEHLSCMQHGHPVCRIALDWTP